MAEYRVPDDRGSLAAHRARCGLFLLALPALPAVDITDDIILEILDAAHRLGVLLVLQLRELGAGSLDAGELNLDDRQICLGGREICLGGRELRLGSRKLSLGSRDLSLGLFEVSVRGHAQDPKTSDNWDDGMIGEGASCIDR